MWEHKKSPPAKTNRRALGEPQNNNNKKIYKMKLSLQSLEIADFKGVRHFVFDPDGRNTTISGPNGAGKSTVLDALTWLLFGKDAAGNTKFPIKPTKPDSDELLPDTEPTVDARFTVDDGQTTPRTVNLQRSHKEKWVKPRGKRKAEFSGYETAYFIDGIKKKEKEFAAFINELVREDVFRYCTSLTHFLSGIDIKVRRRILIEMAGVNEADVPGFDDVKDIVASHTIDDVIKQRKENRKQLIRKCDESDGVIAGLKASRPSAAECVLPDIAYSSLTAQIEELRTQRAAIIAGDNSGLQKEIGGLKDQKRQALDQHQAESEKVEARRRAIKSQIGDKNIELSKAKSEISLLNHEEERLMKEIALVEKEGKAHASALNVPPSTCPTCGQDLGDGDHAVDFKKRLIEEAREGRERCAEMWLKLTEHRKEIEAHIAKLEADCDVVSAEIKRLSAALEELALPEKPDTATIDAKIERLTAQISEAKHDTTTIDAEIDHLAIRISEYDTAKSNAEQARKIDELIAEQEKQQRAVGLEADEADRVIASLEAFVAEKILLTEAKVNALFEPYKWRMFKPTINGGMQNDCELLIPSASGAMVEYSKAGSRGEQIAAGVAVTQVLSKHFGVSLPLFIDNAESLTIQLQTINCQVIKLEAVGWVDGKIHVDIEDKKENTKCL